MNKIINQIAVGNFIHQKRNEFNITQEMLAEKLEISKTAISNWENGVSLIDIKYLVALSNYFSVKIDDILYPSCECKKEEFYNQTKLFQHMISNELTDRSVCDKLIESYILSKKEIVELLKEYKKTNDKKIINKIENKNKYGFKFAENFYELDVDDSYDMQDKENIEDYIETLYTSYHITEESYPLPLKGKYVDLMFDMCYPFGEDIPSYETYEKNLSFIFRMDRVSIFNCILEYCSSRIFCNYIKSFSQEYKNKLITNLYERRKNNLSGKTKNIVKLLLRSGCKYIDKEGNDNTHTIYEKCI